MTIEKRLLPRLTVTHEVFRDERSGKLFAVIDLSPKGMAIRFNDRADLSDGFMVGGTIVGILNLRREKLPVSGRVRHIGKDHIGIEFESLPSETAHAIQRVLDPHVLGQDLRPVPTGDASILYASEGGTEFLLNRESDGRFTKLVILILGSMIQWEERSGLRTGKVRSSDEESYVQGITRLESMIFTEDSAIDPQKLSIAKTLVASSNLSEEVKKFCFRRLEGASA